MTNEKKSTGSYSIIKGPDNSRLLYILIGILSVLLLVQVIQNQTVLRRQFTFEGSDPPPLLIGKTLSPVTLLTIDGEPFELEKLTGEYHLFIFFHTKCPYCELDLSLWRTMYEHSQSQDIDIIAVTLEQDVNAVARYAQEHGIPFPVLRDENRNLFDQLGIFGTPTKVLLSKDMRVLQIWYGWTTQRSNPSDLGAMLAFLGIEPEEIPSSTDQFSASPLPVDK